MVVKTKWVLVVIESVISGHRQNWVRDRTADKVQRLLFDPRLRCQCLYREIQRKKAVSHVPHSCESKFITEETLPPLEDSLPTI